MKFLFTFFLFSIYLSSSSQKIFLNGFAGASNYEGDLQDKFFTFSQPRTAVGFGASYELTGNIFIRGGITLAKITADDKKNSKVAARNLNFTSSVNEFYAVAEYYLFNLDDKKISPYFFGGIAVFHFNPYTTDTLGAKYYLPPLSTEGEGFYQNRNPYKLTQFAIPFGGGIKFSVSDNLRIGIEAGMRKLFTDYLDDVSTTYVDPNLLLTNRGAKALELAFRGGELKTGATYPTLLTKRGEPKNKDWYYFTGITISIRLPGVSGNGHAFKRSKTGCPARVN